MGIEPATFRFVAQCLNHYATAYHLLMCEYNFIRFESINIDIWVNKMLIKHLLAVFSSRH
jgi:hypothetical protein